MNEKELIWVTKEQARLFNEMGDDFKKGEYIMEIIESMKKDIKYSIESLDDDLVMFKAFVVKYSNALKEAYLAQSENVEKLWEESTKPVDNIKCGIGKIKKDIDLLGSNIDAVNNSLKNINTYAIERTINLIDKFNSMSKEDRDLLFRLMELNKIQ